VRGWVGSRGIGSRNHFPKWNECHSGIAAGYSKIIFKLYHFKRVGMAAVNGVTANAEWFLYPIFAKATMGRIV